MKRKTAMADRNGRWVVRIEAMERILGISALKAEHGMRYTLI